jgi:hypothetical protein
MARTPQEVQLQVPPEQVQLEGPPQLQDDPQEQGIVMDGLV